MPTISLRYKLLALVLVPLVLLSGTILWLTAHWSTGYTYEQLFAKVNTDLRVAHDVFERLQSDRQQQLASLAASSGLRRLLDLDDTESLHALLETHRQLDGFDFLNLLNAAATAKLDRDGWRSWQLTPSPLTEAVLRELPDSPAETTRAGIEIYSAERWRRESADLEARVMLPLIDTPRAMPSSRRVEDRAMLIRVLQPVLEADGRRLALLEGGFLLNRNFEFVDEIRELVYGPGSLPEGSRGTVTVFLDDVRITTNVPSNSETRALGTRVSEAVRNAVLDEGENWIDRAFVVNDWYISAYEPIVDVQGNRVGMLYAGFLEAPFRRYLNQAIAVVSVLVLGGSLLAAIAAGLGAKSIYRPIERMAGVARATAAGDRQRIGPIGSSDEIAELARQFDSMLDSLEEHTERIEQDALLLEQKVRDRTLELEHKNRHLEESISLLRETRQQLATAERLAAMGELTAGVAHEINNPTAVILGNMDVLIGELGELRPRVQTEIDLIIEQVYRIRSITDRLLQYSRSGSPLPDAAIPPGPIAVNPLITDALLLVRHPLKARHIDLEEHYGEPPMVAIDRDDLKAVLVNLLTNAIQAVDPGGRIRITTGAEDNGASIRVEDDGCGIAADHLPRLFDPFFTSGKAGGTGLGLSVSYGIVSRHGGRIDVHSRPEQGASFRIWLPAAGGGEHYRITDSGELPIRMV